VRAAGEAASGFAVSGFSGCDFPLSWSRCCCCALATEAIGVHAVFGAFLLGVVIPHDSRLAQEISQRLKDVVTVCCCSRRSSR